MNREHCCDKSPPGCHGAIMCDRPKGHDGKCEAVVNIEWDATEWEEANRILDGKVSALE